MNSKKFRNKFGPWALVTGATSGIRREFAEQLAKIGLNLVLVSRRRNMLDQIGADLTGRFGVETKSVPLDLSATDFLGTLSDETVGLDIGLVISNAGADYMGALLRVPLEDLRAMFRLNAGAHLDIAHHFGSRFLSKRTTSGLLFVSSTASLQATPLVANYAGAKSYVMTLGQALNSELRGKGIHSTVLVPGPTSTPAFHERKDIDLNKMPMPPMKTKRVVRAALKGVVKNKAYVIPGFMNRMLDFMGRKLMTRGMSVGMWGMLMQRVAPANLKF